MSEIILHHYPMSPFAEKIRAILGTKQLAWQSVIIPRVMPKPDVIALTGGYRKTPILQIGADIYCDTALIARKLNQLAPEPDLYPKNCAASAESFAAWADSVLFNAAVALVFQPHVIAKTFAGQEQELQTFVADRTAMRKGATLPRTGLDVAKAIVNRFLRNFDGQLQSGSRFIFGDAPTIADFSVYHPLWFIWTKPIVSELLPPFSALTRWLETMKALGHGTSTELASKDAVIIANDSQTQLTQQQNCLEKFNLGDEIAVQPTDYGIDPVKGKLIYSDEYEIVVLRSDEHAGEVAVHFPPINYAVLKPE